MLQPHHWAGALLARLMPERADEEERHFTIPGALDEQRRGHIGRLIHDHIGRTRREDPAALESLHQRFWAGQRHSDWYKSSPGRHRRLHLPVFGPLVERMRPLLEARGIDTACEFGAGTGLWLDHLSTCWPTVRNWVGVDLCPDAVRAAGERFPHLRFECADLVEWSRRRARPHGIYLTHCGVLEYLSEGSVQRLYAGLQRRAPGSLVLVVEPIAPEMEPEDTHSIPHGEELSFSHNHAYQMQLAGLRVLFDERSDLGDQIMQMVCAEVPPNLMSS